MDENFFHHNEMGLVLALLQRYKVTWLAMSDYASTKKMLDIYGEDELYDCGLRTVEIGLENVVLCKKVKNKLLTKKIAIYYLNLTCLPGETKESIAENRDWMIGASLRHPIHFNNGVWYACGQFYYPYVKEEAPGRMLEGSIARTLPTWIPKTLLRQSYEIIDLEKANYYGQMVFGIKLYRPKMKGTIGEFVKLNQRRAAWLLTGIRCGAIE
jgi:hypothetical protein